ncbi:hypothetical protein GCM10007079_35800 [Nocardiopsis terrae]|uniref:Uncharacterized protein n=1 Tax=Nocardiopsis terrae TaxID=372655 RepID=A0ABR9HD60_9ACTN|nr:hypothetical protein [Nocardiopsis terrae]MBE1456976.1 hypothetical protein [Nocardiopsis terrae]GHC89937.1 hypothetical protein GCM10007079_35800 [Nocardiopsis terrae]
MNQYPDPHQGEPWQQPSGGNPGWGLPPEPHTGGQLEPYGNPTGGYQPAGMGGMPEPTEPTLDTIGDIAITQNTVITPSGRFPIRGTVWTTTDMSRTEQSTPVWAIIVAILFIWTCLLSLLFLLVKDTKTTGHIQVTVQGGGHYHATQIMVSNSAYVQHVQQQVNYARSLAA